ncbi:MAG: hypothetical protein WBQ94_08795 [Terracidiphilus sp.]
MKSLGVQVNPGVCGHHSRWFRVRAWVAAHVRGVMPAVGLFFIAPLVAEFLLGNMSITHLGLLVILAPVYGGGALLIRECVRRTGRGWPSIFLLALAYGIIEEAFLLETLFNPNYLGLNLHLLKPAFLPLFGVGAWYTVFVLTLHTVWSISVPIALVEASVPQRADSAWIGRLGIGIIAVVFALACVCMGTFSVRTDANHFVASTAQFAWSAVIVLMLGASAFSLPRRRVAKIIGRVPDPRIVGICSLVVASAFLLVPSAWGWWAVVAYLSLDTFTVLPIWIWSRRDGWGTIHRLSLAGGAAMAYAWHAFVQTPSLGAADGIARIGNLVFAVLAANLIAAGSRRSGDFDRQQRC